MKKLFSKVAAFFKKYCKTYFFIQTCLIIFFFLVVALVGCEY
nr:MAG TPA: hypothetical protein [Ackermannviridae sp.]DAK97961.1 MAG TPA: hypothetical protein [Ackermannviridae sp.]DAM68020.1 MAG TPA: hypothetical protein [Ackermannviridae sp.]